MSSFTVTLSGNSSELSSAFFPEIVLDEESEYFCALLDLTTYHSIPNINDNNNLFHYFIERENVPRVLDYIKIPTGSYEAAEILEYIKTELKTKKIEFNYKINKNTLKTLIKCSTGINFAKPNSIRNVFGFPAVLIERNIETESLDIVKISTQDVIRVECDIISGSFINGKRSHSIYEFASNKVDVGYKIIEQPKNIIYLPVVPRRIKSISITFVDQNGDLIDFRGESITCRIHIKKGLN